MPADYDGDGKADPALWRTSKNQWKYRASGSGYALVRIYFPFADGDIAVPADYDGDGKADPALWRPSKNQVRHLASGSGYALVRNYLHFADGDIPVVK